MNAIFGLFNRDGRPVSEPMLRRMARSLGVAGPDGARIWRQGPLGLGRTLAPRPAGSGRTEPPREERSDGQVIVSISRIDNRRELIAALDARGPAREMDDSALILSAYREWGRDAPDRLLGDWAFCLWDARESELFLARDHHGTGCLFYYSTPRLFAFASSLKGLLALPEVPLEPNPVKVAQAMVMWNEGGEETCYRGLCRLPPAHAMVVSSGEISLQRYWYLEHVPELRLPSDQDYVDALLEVYTEAVKCRLCDPQSVGATLSGGLDSGSVVALASRELARTGRTLPAFSSVPLEGVALPSWRGRFSDETPYLEATARFLGNVEVERIRAAGVSPVGGLEIALQHIDQPVHFAPMAYWLVELLRSASRKGVRGLLIGGIGNLTVSWPGHQEWPSVKEVRAALASVLGELFSAPSRRAPGSIAARAVGHLRPLLPGWLVRRAKVLRGGAEPWVSYSAISRELVKSIDLPGRMKADGHDPYFRPTRDPRQDRLRYLRPGRSEAHEPLVQLGAAYGTEILDPTADKRVLELCVAMPNDQFRRDGVDRRLIRRAMVHHLPDKVRLCRSRGRQSADLIPRIRRHRQEVDDQLTSLEASDVARGYLDLGRMRSVLERVLVEDDARANDDATMVLMRGLMVGLFLGRMDRPP